MRKLRLFSAVLCLFLLVPASIIWAQVTKTIQGIVRYQSGMSESKFSTPNGDVTINLPQSMTGSFITGTVSTQPAGKTEKEKNRNQKELLKYVVSLDGTRVPLSGSPASFEWLTTSERHLRTPLELLNISGVKVAELSLPPVHPALAIEVWPPGRPPFLTIPSNVLLKDDALNVYTDQQFKPGEKFVLTDSKGQQFIVKPLCMSANQAVLTLPKEIFIGEMTVVEEVWNQPMVKYDVKRAHVNLVNISLTSPNTNLRPGERSTVQVLLHTARSAKTAGQGALQANIDPRITEKDTAEAMQIPVMSIDLRNLNPNTVTMEGGNLQRIPVNQFRQKLMEGEAARIEFQLVRNITGYAVGSFSVSATLHEDHTTSNDPFRPQLNVLNTPQDFNAWINALKKDLGQYATAFHGWDGDDGTGPILVTGSAVQRAIDNMPVCTSPEQLDESKAVAYSLLQPLHVAKGAATMWLSGVEAFKAAAHAIPAVIAGQPQLIDWDMIRIGLNYFRQIGNKLGYDLRNRSDEAIQFIKQIRDEGQTMENLGKLNSSLETLNLQANKALTEMPASMKMLLPGGILFSTKFTPPGMTDFSAEVTEIFWDHSVGSEVNDRITTKIHFTGEVTVQQFAIRVKWESKDGKKKGSADCILKPSDLYYAQTDKFFNCDTIPISLRWPESFKSSGIIEPLPKGEIDIGKLKVIVFVNGNKVGEGKPEGE